MEEVYIVIQGPRSSAGLVHCEYSIYDIVAFDTSLDLENQMRNYAYLAFEAERKTLCRDDISCRRKNIVLHDGTVAASSIKIFDHEDSSFFGFIPKSELMPAKNRSVKSEVV